MSYLNSQWKASSFQFLNSNLPNPPPQPFTDHNFLLISWSAFWDWYFHYLNYILLLYWFPQIFFKHMLLMRLRFLWIPVTTEYSNHLSPLWPCSYKEKYTIPSHFVETAADCCSSWISVARQTHPGSRDLWTRLMFTETGAKLCFHQIDQCSLFLAISKRPENKGFPLLASTGAGPPEPRHCKVQSGCEGYQ